jgi:putative ABC transport system permease protein
MKYALLILSNFKRHKTRTLLTLLSIIVAFVLFAYLSAIRQAFSMGVSVAGADRLVTRHKTSLINLLPASYEAEMERIEGIQDVTAATWFGGIYKDERVPFTRFAVHPSEYLAMFPEFVVPPAQKEAWLRTKTGVIVGRGLVERYGFKVGDKISIRGDIWTPSKGGPWTFDVVGIYDGAQKETDPSQMLLRLDYLDETRRFVKGQVGWYHLKVNDPAQSAAIAKKIDALFENSDAETKTATEAAFVKSWADQIGDIGAIVTAILGAVFFTILLVAGNTMAQAVRERITELGVLKAIGFTDPQMLVIVLAESLMIAVFGGAIGLALGYMLVAGGDPTGGMLPVFFMPRSEVVRGVVFVVLLGLVTGAIPALQAMRLNPVDALRRE